MKDQLPFNKNDRIRIRNYVDPAIYGGMTRNGNEGWVRDIKYDQWGLPIIQIEWDKNHWTYNGAPDGWTFPDHFDKVEEQQANIEPVSGEDDLPSEEAMSKKRINFIRRKNHSITDEETAQPKREEATNPPQLVYPAGAEIPSADYDYLVNHKSRIDNDLRQDAVAKAAEHLQNAEGFIIIGVQKGQSATTSESSSLGLIPFVLSFSLDTKSQIVIESMMADLAADNHKELLSMLWAKLPEEN